MKFKIQILLKPKKNLNFIRIKKLLEIKSKFKFY